MLIRRIAMPEGQIPLLTTRAGTLPLAWEKAVLLCWDKGAQVATEYDRPGSPKSRDCTMAITITTPLREPRIHRAFPGSLEDLEIYRQEVVNGVHDHWIAPEEGKWTYTYHQRLFSYDAGERAVDQIAYMVEKLSQAPSSRRAQAITWNPKNDPATDDPPCLQRIWCRLLPDRSGFVMNMNAHWRSRDAYKAAFMNMFALTDLQHRIAEAVSARLGQKVSVGRYVDISDSFHIYGSYIQEFQQFQQTIRERKFADRIWPSSFAEPFFKEARKRIAQERC
jgi:thymidylate synthase